MTRRRPTLVLLLLLCSWVSTGGAPAPASDFKPTVILVSLDGWRWDYTLKHQAPTLAQLMKRGVSSALIPSFPSKTFPNHYTLVTGLYPGHHGIVSNAVKDPASGRRLTMSNRKEVQDAMWWGGEPLWVTVERMGRPAAPLFWPGSEAPILGQRPRYWEPFDEKKISPNARVDRVLQWLDRPADERPSFITLYFSEVDGAGHDGGPDSMAVREAVRRVDRYLNRLMTGLTRRHLDDDVNVVIVSDHGMGEADTSRVVVLDDYLSLDGLEVIDLNPTLGIFAPADRVEAVHGVLVRAHPRLKVYPKRVTPEHWHFREHPRVPPIVGVVDEGWQLLRRAGLNEQLTRNQRRPIGVHGYDPKDALTMRGIFVAVGPAFRSGVTVAPFENVHVYNALATVLGVTPAVNDGDPQVAKALLR